MSNQQTERDVLSRVELYFSIRQITRTLGRFAEVFERDYDTVMIFLVVVEAAFRATFHLAALEEGGDEFRRLYSEVGAEGVSLLQIGEASGIARETVRRKVKRLLDQGFLATNEKNKNVYLPISTVTRPEFADIFRAHIADIEQFMKSAQFYTARVG
jgi:hypothetical protein